MEWYLVAIAVAGWIILTYAWAMGGIYITERFSDNDFGLAELQWWIGLIVCVLSWPLTALFFDIGLAWYWWLAMFNIIGMPWAIMTSAENILEGGYTYGNAGAGAFLGFSIWWLLASCFPPLQWLATYTTLE